MAYDDGYYYGQCKLVFEAKSSSGNTVTIQNSSGATIGSAAISNLSGEAIVPGRDEYTITFNSNPVWTGKVQCGYGECIKVVLADGYEPIVQKDLDEVKAHLTAGNGTAFQFAYENNKYGYKVGADTFVPFLSGMKQLVSDGVKVVADKDYARAFAIAVSYAGSGSTVYNYEYEKVTRTRGTSTTDETNRVYDAAPLKQPGITVKYTVYDLGELKSGDEINRAIKWTSSTTPGRFGGQLTVLVIE